MKRQGVHDPLQARSLRPLPAPRPKTASKEVELLPGEEEEEEVEVEVEELVEEYVEDAEEDPEEDGLEEDAEAEEEEAEDLLGRLRSCGKAEERLQTDVDLEDLEDEDEATLDELADDSDSDQPGTTLEDGGQCDEAVEERKLLDEEPAVEKKPPVPRFPHPIGPKVKEAAPPAPVAVTERVPLRERFARHLLLGRFPKRKILADAQDSANEADNEAEEEKPKDDPGEDEPSSEDQAARPRARLPVPSRRRAARAAARADGTAADSAASLRPGVVLRLRRVRKVAEPTRTSSSSLPAKADTDGGESSTSKGRSFLSLVGKSLPRKARREAPLPKAVWKEPVETLLSLGSLYFSFSSMRNAEGQKVALKNRDKVVQTLHELNSKVALPICRHFGLRYNFFSEHHPQAKKAGVTCKEPLILRKQGPDGTEIQESSTALG
eukprot:g11267.t1